jgi:hypothetical protein
MFKGHIFLALVLGALLSAPAHAEVLLLDAIKQEPPNSSEGLPRPARGMTMDQVRTAFGEPSKTYPAVGEPPITRWDYPAYSVFFEHQYVLNTVVHRKP